MANLTSIGIDGAFKLLLSKKHSGVVFNVKYLCVWVYVKIALTAYILQAPMSFVIIV